MKKIYFMLISFLCIVLSAQAAKVTNLSQLSDDKLYTIRSERAFLLYANNTLASSNGQSVSATRNPQDPNQQFQIKKSGSNYLLYSVGAKKYVMVNAQNTVTWNATRGSNVAITSTGNAAYPWKIKVGNFYLNSQDPNQTATAPLNAPQANASTSTTRKPTTTPATPPILLLIMIIKMQ